MIACIFSFGAGVLFVLALVEADQGDWGKFWRNVFAMLGALAAVAVSLLEARP